MKETTCIPQPITLDTLLLAKDERFELQQSLLKQYSLPVVCLTITLPGPIKLNDTAIFLFELACQQLSNYYQQHHIECIKTIKRIKSTGPEAFWVVNQPEESIKKACIEIEQNHVLGRLWDIDVISALTYTTISRRQFGYSARKCLICDSDAKACGRSRQHSLDLLNETIVNLVSEYKASL